MARATARECGSARRSTTDDADGEVSGNAEATPPSREKVEVASRRRRCDRANAAGVLGAEADGHRAHISLAAALDVPLTARTVSV